MKRFLGFFFAALWLVGSVQAADVTVAVAASFTRPMQQIAQQFERDTGFRVTLAFASTGRLYAQIKNGAPFDVLLSADERSPSRLSEAGDAVAGTQFTYAIGRLVLWSRDPNFVDAEGQILKTGSFSRLAIADPRLAPYGAAALEVMTRMGVWDALQPRIVYGENIAQAHQFIASQNAQLGFLAMAQVFADGRLTEGSAWVVPNTLHAPIRQDAVLLRRAQANPAAIALMAYLKSDKALTIIRSFGYEN